MILNEKLLELSSTNLLEKFGAGSHKPGSGSAAALQGMLSAQLIKTVINLTTETKRKEIYEEWLPKLHKITVEIDSRIYPALQRIFQFDSEQFGRTISLRKARDTEADAVMKTYLADEARKELQIATEVPIEIAQICVELAEFAAFIFDHGFRSARGDASVAHCGAVAAVAGSLSIVEVNLLSFRKSSWKSRMRSQTDLLRVSLDQISKGATNRLDSLKKESELKENFHTEVDAWRLNFEVETKLTNLEIENAARQLQNVLWKYREIVWRWDTPTRPLDILKPETALKKILGYEFHKLPTLGTHQSNGEFFEVAGIINNRSKSVHISAQFPFESQNFTTAHELGHALLHKEAVLHRDRVIDGSGSNMGRDNREIQADKFAAYFLMPTKQVINVFKQLFFTEHFIINDDTVFALNAGSVTVFRRKCQDLRGLSRVIASADLFSGNTFRSMSNIFNVSVETMAIRLEELDLVEF